MCQISGSGGRTKTITLPVSYVKHFLGGNVTDSGAGCFSYGINSTSKNSINVYVAPQYITDTGLILTANAVNFWIAIFI